MTMVAGVAMAAACVAVGARAWAQGGETGSPASAPATTPAAAPAAPAAPTKIPVPSGPVVATSNVEGIVIEDLVIGTGAEIKTGGAVVAYYHGTLKADPTKVFDSAFDRGQPVAFPLTGVIAGWQKGVPGMKVGGVRRLTIPAALAYGPSSPSPSIPPNSDLVFVIQITDTIEVIDTKEGTGEAVEGLSVPATNFVIKDAKGEVVAKSEEGMPYIWLPNEFDGLSAGLEGMKVGGKRTIKVPKEFNEPTMGLPPNRPTGVPLTIEVELVANRNLPRR